jgi:hypothetical protein
VTITTILGTNHVTELGTMGIIKQGKFYHFKLWIPSQFQDGFGKKTFKFSLKTTHHREALKRANLLKFHIDTALNQLQKGHSMDRQALNTFIREYVRGYLDGFDQEQAHGKSGNSDTVDKELFGYDFIIPELKESKRPGRSVIDLIFPLCMISLVQSATDNNLY